MRSEKPPFKCVCANVADPFPHQNKNQTIEPGPSLPPPRPYPTPSPIQPSNPWTIYLPYTPLRYFLLKSKIATPKISLRVPTQDEIKEADAKVIILSGGPNSVHVEGAPQLPAGFFDYVAAAGIPVLGICYGMQLMVQVLGGKVQTPQHAGEYGRTVIRY